MSKRNPIERSEYINNRYKEYLRSSFQFESDRLQSLFEKQLDDEDLFKGPYVDLNLPFKRGKNLNELISEGVVCQTFKNSVTLTLNDHYILTKKRPFVIFAPVIMQLLQPVQGRENRKLSLAYIK